jgi:hypothetical protein
VGVVKSPFTGRFVDGGLPQAGTTLRLSVWFFCSDGGAETNCRPRHCPKPTNSKGVCGPECLEGEVLS